MKQLQKWWFIASLFFAPFTSGAQSKLLVLGKCPDCYVQYRVKPGETIENLAAMAGMSLLQFKEFNKISSNDPAFSVSSVRIPLSAKNLLTEKTALPVFHVVEKGDNLYRLNIQYFNPGLPRIKEWNQLRSETVKDGDILVVGYLGGNMQQANSPAPATPSAMVAPPASTPPVVADVTPPAKQVVALPQVSPSEGYYAAQFKAAEPVQQLFEISGTGGIFKSITGWNDKRYYVLMNEVVPGSIVRITVDQVKYICAKVLGPIPDNKPNKGLLIRLSNAAATALGISAMIFTATVNYFQ